MVRKTISNLLARLEKLIQYEVELAFCKEIYDRGFGKEETSKRRNKETKQENKKMREARKTRTNREVK